MIKYVVIFLLLPLQTLGAKQELQQIEAHGELKAANSSAFSPPKIKNFWQYTIAFMAEDGSVVQAGMPVLMFKTEGLQSKLIEAQGKLTIKKSTLQNLQVNQQEFFENKNIELEEKKMQWQKAKHKAALPNKLVAKNDYKENQLNLKKAKIDYDWIKKDIELNHLKQITEEKILTAEITKLQKKLNYFQQSISKMNMMASTTGVVMHKTDWNGNKFAIGDSVWGGQRVMEIADLSKIIATLEIDENIIKNVKTGQKVKIILDSMPDKEYYGTIQKLANVVRIKSKNQPAKILDATVSITTVDEEVMRPGMRLTAYIMLGESL